MHKFLSTVLVFLCLFFFPVSLLQASPIIHAGQRFILTLPENSTKKDLASWLKKTKPAGVMLLASHVKDRLACKKLITFLQKETKKLKLPELFISIDWEGGIVSRPTESGGFHSAPSPWSLAQAGRPACFLAGMLIGSQMRSIGANVNFAPSLDLFDQDNQVLATRCFSSDPEVVITSGIAFSHGLMSQGVLPVIKHFPGLGLGQQDTHLERVDIKVNNKILKKHMHVFDKVLQEKIPMIMATHASYKQFGSKPMTLSQETIIYLKKQNSKALFITDDFCMKGVLQNKMLEDAALEALAAGFHLLIFSGIPETQIKLINTMQEMLDELPEEQQKVFAQKNQEINNFKKKFIYPGKINLDLDEAGLAQELAKKCVKTSREIPDLDNKKIIMITTNLSMIRPPETWFIKNKKSYLGNLLDKQEFILNPKDQASTQELKAIISGLNNHKNIIILQTFFYADNIWNKIQEEWLNLLKPLQKNLIVISLGHPHEQQVLPQATIINCGSFHIPILHQTAQLLSGKIPKTGADKFIKNLDKYLVNKNFGLLCHRCSVVTNNKTQAFLPDILCEWARDKNNNSQLVALFSPEHGLLGTHQDAVYVASENNSRWGCPVYSLHGVHKSPTPDMLKNLDLLIIDFQDVGVRCFTYLSSMQLALEAAAKNNIPVLVLDRPNPLLKYWQASGPMLEKNYESFLGKLYVPFIHGSSIGQLALEINKNIGAQLTVILADQEPDFFYINKYISPSPNLPSLDHVFAYPITVFLEGTNYSEGRGTHYPFLQIGAPWVNSTKLAQVLNSKKLSGVYFEPITFTPINIPGMAENPKHYNILCHGVFMHLYNHKKVNPMLVAKTILKTLFMLYPKESVLLKFSGRYGLDLRAGQDTWRKELT